MENKQIRQGELSPGRIADALRQTIRIDEQVGR